MRCAVLVGSPPPKDSRCVYSKTSSLRYVSLDADTRARATRIAGASHHGKGGSAVCEAKCNTPIILHILPAATCNIELCLDK